MNINVAGEWQRSEAHGSQSCFLDCKGSDDVSDDVYDVYDVYNVYDVYDVNDVYDGNDDDDRLDLHSFYQFFFPRSDSANVNLWKI